MSRVTAPASPDEESRRRIEADLETNFLVEAAAGTGKTTSLALRVVALVRAGRAEISQIAAVTFTRKAASELRARIAAKLERGAENEPDAGGRERLAAARREIDRAFIGTIHSFCARLLRERPVEAGVDPEFREIEEDEDALLKEGAWREHVEELYARDRATIDRLAAIGVEPKDLRDGFDLVAKFPDVVAARAAAPAPDFSAAIAAAAEFLDDLVPRLRAFGDAFEPDDFISRAWKAWHFRENADFSSPAEAAEFLEILNGARLTQGDWPDAKLAKSFSDRFKELKSSVLEPAIDGWRVHRHGAAIDAIVPAIERLARRRRDAGAASFADLLILTRDMLRRHPGVRSHFRERFPRLLVDEFQDTDPIQAEVMAFLAADDPGEANWKDVRLRPGALFVVGDPKQSIYRFRRADIDTYRRVRELIERSGGSALTLSKSFRGAPAVVERVNAVFSRLFDGSVPHQAADVPLVPARSVVGGVSGAFRLVTAAGGKNEGAVAEADAPAVARWIAGAIRGEMPISVREDAGERERPVRPEDVLVLLWKTSLLETYARAIEAEGIAVEVTGGKAYGDSEEVRAFVSVLRAIADPDDPVPLVAYLRGPLCGIDDDALFRFNRAGGKFHFRSDPPAGADPRFSEAFARLSTAQKVAAALPPAAAIGRIAIRLGLLPTAFADEAGGRRAGNLARMISFARVRSAEGLSLPECLDDIDRLIERGKTPEMDIEPVKPNAVRVMNLHKAKGLEAPVVILAAPHDPKASPINVSIDRENDPAKGYFRISRSFEFSEGSKTIAVPARWEELAETEKEYESAEQDRLRYVAATRAMNVLVVCGRRDAMKEKAPARHGVWQALASPELPDAPKFAGAGRKSVPRPNRDLAAEFELASREIVASREAMVAPGYAVSSPSKFEAGVFVAREATGRGMSWGRILHRLLEAAMRDRSGAIDFRTLAENLLRDEERPVDEAPDLVAILERVRKTEVWKRASASPECFVEIPFATVVRSADYGRPDPPAETLLNGAIDLVFREDGVWKLIDYKSDTIAGSVADLVQAYRPQLSAYRQEWAKITGQPTEAGICFLERPDRIEWIE